MCFVVGTCVSGMCFVVGTCVSGSAVYDSQVSLVGGADRIPGGLTEFHGGGE